MVESVLAICVLIQLLATLAYFYFREFKNQAKSKADLDSMRELFRELSTSKDSFTEELTASQNKLLERIFESNHKSQELYLKHINSLEKVAIPKQQDKIIDQIIGNIRQEDAAKSEPNDIEKDPETLQEEEFSDVFRRIPITQDTKVAVEDAPPPEEEILV